MILRANILGVLKTLAEQSLLAERRASVGGFHMPGNRNLHKFYGLFPTALLDRETEEMIDDEGLLARFWGAWFDACLVCFNTMAREAMNGGASASPRSRAQR